MDLQQIFRALLALSFALGACATVPPPPPGTAKTCGSTSSCNNLSVGARPPCTAATCNACKDGYCVWQVDWTNADCKCVPGTVRKCSGAGYSTCNASGTAWGACS